MDFQKLNATFRITSGKGPARRLRQNGHVPAVLYGKGVKETLSLTLVPRDLIKAVAGPLRTNTPLAMSIAGAPAGAPAEVLVMVRDHQFDPVSRELLHVDFLAVDPAEKVQVKVPMEITGRSVGVFLGGRVSTIFRDLPVECVPAKIPAVITVDITPLEINTHLTVDKLELPEGVTITLSAETRVVSVLTAKAEVEEKVEGADAVPAAEADAKKESAE